MKTAVYPGAFDPVTNGHIDIIERALKLFDKLYILVGDNPQKAPTFSPNERVEMLAQNKECILLMDLDKAGRRLHAHMKGDLQHAGVRVNSRFRNFLLTITRLRFIEGLDTYMKNLGFR